MKTPGTSAESKVLSLAATLILIAIVLLGGVWLRQSPNRESGRKDPASDRRSVAAAAAAESDVNPTPAARAGQPRPDATEKKERSAKLENLDTRGTDERKPEAGRLQALAVLKTKIPGVAVQFDPITGAPDHIMAAGRFLAQGKSQPGDAYAPVRDFVNEHADLFGHDATAMNDSRVTREDVTAHNGMRTVVWQQQVDGIPLYNTILKANLTKDGALVTLGSHFMGDAIAATGLDAAQRTALAAQPPVDVKKAVSLAAANLGDAVAPEQASETTQPQGAERMQRFTAPKISDTFAQLAWLPVKADSARLTWDVTLMSLAQNEMFRVLVDARTGEVLMRTSLTADVSDATFRVYADATTKKPFDSPAPMLPGTPTPSGAQGAEVPRQLVTLQSVNPTASPNGWINDGVFETLGNNVDAHTDTNADNVADLPRPTSATRIFDFPMDLTQAPSTYKDAAVVHLFYMNNWMHDQLYTLGFTETAGNFQTNNFGRGGLGNDPVLADGQDGSGTNNANMSTPTDGSSPRMQMYIFTGPTPDRDGDFDDVVLLHEYTHGLSNRLVGGGVGISATATGGMGEGWSDFYGLGLMADPASDPNAVYPGGSYATLNFVAGMTTNYYYGIRRYPYSTDMTKNPLTFRDIDPTQASPHTGIPLSPLFGSSNSNPSEVHNVGEVWCMTLWECRAKLIAKHGPSGAQTILQLVTDGMKLSPVNPNLLQARDAIIQADLVSTGGADSKDLWMAFAKRGMGASATAPTSSTTTGVVEAFDVPDDLGVSPLPGITASGTITGPFSSSTYTLSNSGAAPVNWTAARTQAWLSISPTSGTLAPGTTATFTVSFTAAANALPAGVYSDTITFTDANNGVKQTRAVSLTVLPITDQFFYDGFESGTLNPAFWTSTGTNTFRTLVTAANTPRAGTYHLTMDSSVDGTYARNELTLTLNLAGRHGALLKFWAKMFSDEPDGPPASPFTTGADFDGVAISLDGTTWYEARGLRDLGASYAQYTIDLDAAIALHGWSYNSTFKIRFNHYDNFGIPTDGFAFDDIEVVTAPLNALTVTAPASVNEGAGTVNATVSVPAAPVSNLVVNLTSTNPAELTVPATVTILAGQTSATFAMTVIDDTAVDGTQNVAVVATVAGYAFGSATVAVNDNETAVLTLTVPPATAEGAGTVSGTVAVSVPAGRDVTVALTSSDTTAIQVPATVLIPAGQTSAAFTITVIDDTKINGTHSATITAHVANWTDGTGTIGIADNENTNLTLVLPATVTEGATGTGTVSIAGTLPTALVVSLSSNNTPRLTVPTTATISAGATSATFTLTGVNNTLTDGTAPATVSATAAGFTGANATTSVLDNDVHHFTVGPIASPQTRGVPFSVTVTAKDVNDVTIASYTTAVGLSASGAGGADSITPTTTTAFVSGVWTGSVTVNTFDTNVVLTANDGLGHTGASNAFDVTTGLLDHFAWSTITSPQSAGTAFNATITAKDLGNNTVTGFTGTAALNCGLATKIVGTGTASSSVLPLYTFYHDQRSQCIYLQSEIGTAGTIKGLTLNVTTIPGQTMNNWTIRMKHTSLTSYATAAWESTSWTTVYQANQTISTTGLATFTFSTPFVYDGVSNLMVDFSFNNSSYTTEGAVVSTTASAVRSIHYYTDSGFGDPLTWSGTTNPTPITTTVLPNLQLQMDRSIVMSPTVTGNFGSGAWTGPIAVQQSGLALNLRADDGAGHTGDSNPFNVNGTVTANAQSVNVTFNTAKPVTLTGQDSANAGAILTYAITTQPAHGTLSGTAPNVTYTPTSGYQGADSFTFTAANGPVLSLPATVSITVLPGTPTATPQSLTVANNTPRAITLAGTDPDVPPLTLTFAVAAQPAHGIVTGTAPNVTYTPANGYSGPDSFTFTASNGTNTSAPATITLAVATGTPVADPQSVSTPLNVPKAITLTGSDPDVPALPLTFAIVAPPTHGALTGAVPNVTYTPATGYLGPDSFTFTVNNGVNTSTAATVVISIGSAAILEPVIPIGLAAGNLPKAPLILATDGNYYGITSTGGSSNLGTVFKMTPAGVLTSLVNFYGANGATPLGGLVQAADGTLYGTTSSGGASNLGTIFKITAGGTFSTMVHCTSTTGTVPKAALLLASDGNLYGTTSGSGSTGVGTIFKLTPAGVLTVLTNFSGTTGSFLGSNCSASLIQASDGNLYGTTVAGGSGAFGNIFKVTTGGTFTNLVSFTGTTGTVLGTAPQAALVQGTDGLLYGTTNTGGTGNIGTVFKITTAGIFTNLVSFTGTTGVALGSGSQSTLIQWATDGNFYGTTNSGGTNSSGTIFKVTPAGVFTTVRSLSSSADGSAPNAGMVLGADGNFWGTTSGGGQYLKGVVFSIAPATTTYSRVMSFPNTPAIFRSLLLGSDGNFYGVTVGPQNGIGPNTIFKLTAGGVYTTLYSGFSTSTTITPYLMQGADGNLYGTAPLAPSTGSIFKLTTAGIYTTLGAFTGTTGAFPGTGPYAGITQGSDGDLYGATQSGGTGGGFGTVFKVSTAGSATSLASLTGTTGANLGTTPQTRLVQGADGNFYGTTQSGGSGGGFGTVFKITPAGALTTLVNFTGTTGASLGTTPNTNLLRASDGNLYGTTTTGGTNSAGTIFKIAPDGTFTSLLSFTNTSLPNLGNFPSSNLIEGSDGNFYGTTTSGGTNGIGTVYKVTPAGVLTTLVSFTGTGGVALGSTPHGTLKQGNDGYFYGTTTSGGRYNVGTVFRVSSGGSFASLYSFGTDNDGGSPNIAVSSLYSDSFRLVAGSDGFLYGVNASGVFKVHQQPAPQAVTVTGLTPTGATLTGSVIANQDPGTVYYEYGLNTNYGTQTAVQAITAGTSPVPVIATLGSLLPGQIYHFRMVTVTSQGTFTSADQTFATPAAPLVVTGSNVGAGRTGVSLDGSVNPLGTATSCYFEYGATTAYGSQTATQNVGNGIAATSVDTGINGLPQGTACHVRLVATNSYGTTFGDDQVIVTLPAPTGMVQPSFQYLTTGTAPVTGLVLGADGNFYGTTNTGGTRNTGTVFKVSPSGTLRTLGNFTGGSNGLNPQGSLVQAANGNWYGTTNTGGANNLGTAFMVTPDGVLTTLASLNNITGYNPVAGLTLGTDGNFYGVGQNGGTSGVGTIFRMTPAGTITVLVNFTGTTGANLGSNPRATLLLASDGNFYGTTLGGGSGGGFGTIFKMTPAGVFTTLVNFTGTTGAALGSAPLGALVQGPDGNFYGTTSTGGTGSLGTAFMVTPAGVLATLANFTGITGAALGSSPKGPLALGGDGSFYGTTQSGGTGNFGTAFKVTSAGALTTLVNFTGTTGAALGTTPQSGLVLGNDGNFYGTTSSGGLYGQGTVFKVSSGGVLTTLMNFNTPPVPSKLVQGSDSNLYGTTLTGGGNLGYGTVFGGPVGGGLKMLAPLVPTSGTTALNSQGGLIQGTDGNYYGTSQSGGSFNSGSVFKITPAGVLSTLVNFSGTTGANLGSAPRAALLLGSDGNFWGTTNTGGSGTSFGTIFKMTPAGVQTTVINFTGITGANLGTNAQAPLILGSDGNYYGTASGGGTSSSGTVFKVTPAGVFTTLVNFTGIIGTAVGSTPSGFLVQGNDGNFYGTTQSGGFAVNGFTNQGTVFRVTPGGAFTSLASFSGSTGALPGQAPTMGLVKGQDGFLYGTTTGGGTNNLGTIFRVLSDGSVASLYSFAGGPDGLTPTNGLTALSDGSIYGVDNMTVFGLIPPPAAVTSPATSVFANSATLNGLITAETNAADAYFEYGPTSAFGSTTATQNFPASTTASAITASITGLQPFLTYHCRAVASSNLGMFPGADVPFSTPNVATFNSVADVPVTINGFTAAGLPFNLVLGFAPTIGTRLTVVRNTGTNPIAGTFTGLPEGASVSATFGAQTYLFQISYTGGDGNDITLTAVSQAITFPAIGNRQSTDVPFALAATATSGLPVSYTVVAGGGVASVAGNTVTLNGTAGVVTIKAVQPGNGSFGPAAPVYQTFVVINASPFVQIVSSKTNDFTLGIRANGTLWAWGLNSSGQLGNGTTTTARTPVQIGTATNWQTVSAGGSHAVAVRTDGTLWAWGLNSSGQLGDTTTTTRTAPVQIAGTTWKTAIAGNIHTVAIKTDGTLWAWGGNANGQLAQGSTDALTHPAPLQVGALTTWAQSAGALAAGTDFSIALKTDGTAWGWGLNSSAQLADTTFTSPRSTLVQSGAGSTWSTVAAGQTTVVAKKSDGSFWVWGTNTNGQYSDGTNITRAVPQPYTALANLQDIQPGGLHLLATKTDGTLWAWGSNSPSGQLGLNTADTAIHSLPAQAGAAANWQLLAPGATHSVATRSDGTVWAWGANTNGQLGNLPRLPLPLAQEFGPVVSASGGTSHSVAIKSDGSMWVWGLNSNGQLGLGATDSIPHASAIQLGAGSVWQSASAGSTHTLALRSDGTLWACGSNGNGQMGDGTTITRPSLFQIGTDQWRSISAGVSHSCAVKADGTLWAWGNNGNGQLGDGTTVQRYIPTQIGTDVNWKSVVTSGGGSFTIAIKTDGTLWSWGLNGNGQLGDGTTTQRLSPAQIGTAKWLAAAVGNTHVVAIRSDGTLWAWGSNTNGRLGDGTTTQRTSPLQIGTDTTWNSVAANSQTLATKSDGTLWAWGSDGNGQLGDGNMDAASHSTPARVGASNGWASVGPLANSNHSLAITVDGTLWGFGFANSGQIGLAWRNQLVPDVTLPALSPAQTITFSVPASVTLGNTITLAATASSGLPASYIVSGPATLNGDELTVTGPGLVTVVACQAGDNYWQSSDIAVRYINAAAPVVTGVAVSNLTTTTATLNGTVNPNGTITVAKFQSGSTPGYGTDTQIFLNPNNGVTNQNAGTVLTGLTPGATYHFRVTATNAGGTTDSADVIFNTISLSNANLSGLVPGSGVLAPVFTGGNLNYDDSVSNATAGMTVTPTALNPNSTIQVRVNGAAYSAVASGTASASLALNVGANTVNVLVTAQDTVTTQLYTIAVTRRTPYQDWAVANGLGLGAVAMDPNGDSDGDGVKNIHEWAFGTSPGSAALGSIQVSGGVLLAHGGPAVLDLPDGLGGVIHYALFGRRKDAASVGLAYTVEFCDQLSGWTVSSSPSTVIAQDSQIEAVIVPFPPTVTDPPSGYFRIGVTGQ